jgi:hypothetical protein
LFDFIVKHELDKMFKYRHKVTKKIIEGWKWKNY